MTSSPLRAAVIGVGYLGRFHAQKYQRIPNVTLVGVVDSHPHQAHKVGQELNVPAYTDYRDLFGQVDLVSICVPTSFHYGVTAACLEAGIHTLVEKPITVTLNEADDLIALAAEHQRVLQVGHLKRFHPAVAALKASGLVTAPRYIESQRLAPFKSRAMDVDVVLDLMIHDVDLILNFVGADLLRVEAVGAPVITRHVDMANARLTFANGAVASINASRIAQETSRRLRLFQEESVISLDFPSHEIQVQRKGQGTMTLDGVEVPAIERFTLPIPRRYDTLEAEIHAFCDAVRLGTPPLVSGVDGRRALEVVIAIQRAIHDFVHHRPAMEVVDLDAG